MLCMVKHYNDPRWVTVVQIMDKNGKYHPGQKWHLQAVSKAVWVEYWYPYDLIEKKGLTWEQYKKALTQDKRSEEEFWLSTRDTPVYNTSMVDGMPPLKQREITDAEAVAAAELLPIPESAVRAEVDRAGVRDNLEYYGEKPAAEQLNKIRQILLLQMRNVSAVGGRCEK